LLHHFLLFIVENAWVIQDNTALCESKIHSSKETSETTVECDLHTDGQSEMEESNNNIEILGDGFTHFLQEHCSNSMQEILLKCTFVFI